MTLALGLLSILSAYAVMKISSPAALTRGSQAETLASDLRRAQALAYTSGRRMRFSITSSGANGSYAVACTTGSTPCGSDFTGALSQGASLGSGSALYFNTLGQPSNVNGIPLGSSTSYSVSVGGVSTTVSVAAQTGRVTVGP
ncbi:hypothetical protein [Roseateles violae]|uniref:MSHA pilin protein MshC n=1 Tax=Roseateles violae TaxID=3058042 RepID=A0ABT8DWZ5_9BURK|nr:hypothetical protein [Pelomonas sp. PFR6]MDN3921690.1 hypothetical protein [Pelomonas sp. PFR6]